MHTWQANCAARARGRRTLAESLTAVLLGEIVDLLRMRPDVHDPRVTRLIEHDREHATSLVESVQAYLREHGDVRTAAASVTVHPNTLRYRMRRVEEILGMDLANPSDRLLLELQLAITRS